MLGLVGPSGCGKSTLLEIVAGLQEPTAGQVAVEGRPATADRLAACVLMPQRDLLLPWRSALDNAGLALELGGVGRREARRRAAELFERFGLGEFAAARPDELSGGMRQRVAFARTLLAARPVLLLDEPFASLDAITRAELQEWTARSARRGAAHGAARDARHRGGALPLRPRPRALAAAGARADRAARAPEEPPARAARPSPRRSSRGSAPRALEALA